MDDVQSWWEIPCIAHFCSLFRLYFDLIDFDIEDLEEALLTDSAEEVASSLIQELIVRLLKGCFNLQKDEITTCNYQMYLRRLFRKKCEEGSTKNNPFDRDAAFHSLPLRTKVEILYDLCDFRLDNEDVPECLKSLEADSLRVEPLGQDSGGSTYWYFYGTRLYREDYTFEKSSSNKRGQKKVDKVESSWQVVCFTEEDWQVLTRKFKNCKSVHERNLHRTLSVDFLPELPRLFAEKERLQRKRMLEQQLRRTGRSLLATPENTTKEDMPISSKKSLAQPDIENRDVRSPIDDNDEEEARRLREEQERADRLLAEEIEREERKARLHLRERRGGLATTSCNTFSSLPDKISEKSSKSSHSQRKSSGSRSSSANKSPVKSTSSFSKKAKSKKKAKGRMTNNSLAASIQSVALSKVDPGDDGEDSEAYSDGQMQDVESDHKKSKTKMKHRKSRSPTSSRSPSPVPVKKSKKDNEKIKKQKSSDQEHISEKPAKVKGDKSKDKKKRKLKHKDKVRDKDRSKTKTEKSSKSKEKHSDMSNHHSSPPLSLHSSSVMGKTKVKSSVIFSQSEEDIQIGMHKVIESIKNHGDAWPFLNPVDEDYAPNYYRVISSPMDLQTMEDKLDNREYISLEDFIADFHRIVNNCTKYNGPSSEYTEMAEALQEAFNKAIQRYIVPDDSDEEISIEYHNVSAGRKRQRNHSHSAKEDIAKECKKENDPNVVKKTSKSKSKEFKKEKGDKKKMKHKLMRHHSRNSEVIENLSEVAAETLKDINKILGDGPRHKSQSENLKMKSVNSDVSHKHKSSVAHKRKSSGSSQEKDKRVDEGFGPPSKIFKKADRVEGTKSTKPYNDFEDKGKKPKSSDYKKKDHGKVKDKDKRSHHKHKHRKGNSSPKTLSSNTSSKFSFERDSNSEDKPILKSSKSVEEKKQKPNVKRTNSVLSSLKGSSIKRSTLSKPTKISSSSSEAKFKAISEAFIAKKELGDAFSCGQSTIRDHSVSGGEKPEKKKCLLINDTQADKEGGPRLSLGTVLPTDAIKLGDGRKSDDEFDENDEPIIASTASEIDKTNISADETKGSANSSASKADSKSESNNDKDADSEDIEVDRKLEPSKGFNREKCMPNLSAWIKAFGGPSKPNANASSVVNVSSPQPKKFDGIDPKSKFKVMGRGVADSLPSSTDNSSSNNNNNNKIPHKPLALPPKVVGKVNPENWNNQTYVISSLKAEQPYPPTIAAEEPPFPDTHRHKKDRHRKMSTSSMSSASERGSPHAYAHQEGPAGMGNVVNPPRWVDEHWTQNHSQQSQSPSASSHVSSQSPANSPFSPALNSPPQTPQTPPRPVAPVRVGFYQDITSQHSSPEKLNDPLFNSSVASPSTPPTPTNSTNSSARRDTSAKNFAYSPPMYNPRYASSTPSPNVAPNSSLQSPSPGGNVNVESPGNPNSPHSPSVPGGPSPADYRHPPYTQSSPLQGQGSSRPQSSHPRIPSAASSPAPTISPYPPAPVSHYGHPSVINHPEAAHSHSSQPISQAHSQPAMAHMNQVQAHSHHQQHYDRYAHLHPGMSQPGMTTSAGSPSLAHTGPNMTAAHSQKPNTAQPPPFPTNPYGANPRSIPPNVYNNPMSSDAAVNRLYKASVSSGELTLTAGSVHVSSPSAHTSSSSGSQSRKSSRSGQGSSDTPRASSASSEAKLTHSDVNGFQWPHNLASLTQIVNSIPNPMTSVGMANAYRQYDQAVAESMNKYQRGETTGYTNLNSTSGGTLTSSGKVVHPPAAHSQPADKIPSDIDITPPSTRKQSGKSEKSSSRSQSSGKGSQSNVSGSAFNFSALSPADLALYPKEMPDGSLYSASPPSLAHRSELYTTSTGNFHSAFPSSGRSSASGVPTPSLNPYQIPPFIGSHPSPYQPQSVSSQPFAHSQTPRSLAVDPYQQFFQSSPHVMGLLPPTGYPYPPGLGFNRPGWI